MCFHVIIGSVVLHLSLWSAVRFFNCQYPLIRCPLGPTAIKETFRASYESNDTTQKNNTHTHTNPNNNNGNVTYLGFEQQSTRVCERDRMLINTETNRKIKYNTTQTQISTTSSSRVRLFCSADACSEQHIQSVCVCVWERERVTNDHHIKKSTTEKYRQHTRRQPSRTSARAEAEVFLFFVVLVCAACIFPL